MFLNQQIVGYYAFENVLLPPFHFCSYSLTKKKLHLSFIGVTKLAAAAVVVGQSVDDDVNNDSNVIVVLK